MSALTASYVAALKAITERGSVWVESPNGWYHTYNRAIVEARKAELRKIIHKKQGG